MADKPQDHERRYDPLTSERPPRRGGAGTTVALTLTVLFHVGIGAYIWNAKFNPKYKTFSDHAVAVDIQKAVKKAPPPPPPPPPPPKPRNAPPPPPMSPHIATPMPGVSTQTTVAIKEVPKAPQEPEAPKHASVISRPDWLRRPSNDEMVDGLPDRAVRMNQNGKVVISCVVTESGTLTDCSVVSQNPDGFGFGEYALKKAHLFRMKPKTEDGQAVGGARVTIPITVTIPEEE